jgi:hypothetical protein
MEQTSSTMAYKLYPIQANILRALKKFFLKQQVIGQECKKAGLGHSNTLDEVNVYRALTAGDWAGMQESRIRTQQHSG